MGASNYVTGILNFFTMLLSIPIIGAGIWLATKHDTECVRFLQWPVIIIGVFIFLMSIAGFFGSCFRISWLLWFYLLGMFLLILLLVVFTVFTFAVTNKGAGHALSNKGFKEYRLGDYSNWLQNRVEKASNWRKIKSCLQDAKVCKKMDEKYDTVEKLYAAHLSPLQSGCCKPPTDCNYSYQNATFWTPNGATTDADCKNWSNDQKVLCFNCDACKAGLLQNIKQDWRKVAIVNIIVFVFLVVVYSCGCCAFRNARRDNYYRKPYA